MEDNLVYENSMNGETNESPFTNKQWLYLIDQNNGVYDSGQIQFDSTEFTNNGLFMNWNKGYITIPFVLGLYGQAYLFIYIQNINKYVNK